MSDLTKQYAVGTGHAEIGDDDEETSSAGSWPDEPSDEEILFGLSGDEALEGYTREKRRRWVEKLREERLRGLEAEDEEQEGSEEDEVDEEVCPFSVFPMVRVQRYLGPHRELLLCQSLQIMPSAQS